MKIRPQAVVIPEPREFPGLGKRQGFAAWLASALAPRVDVLFRPEEQDMRSGDDEIVVPALEREREVDNLTLSIHLAAADPERHWSLGRVGVAGLDLGVRL